MHAAPARTAAPYLIAWLACAALIGGVALYAVAADRERDRDAAETDAGNRTLVVQGQSIRTLDRIDHALSMVRAFQELRLSGVEAGALFQTLRFDEDARRAAIFDRDGRFVVSTEYETVLKGASVAKRDYFLAARASNSDAMIVASPRVGSILGRLVTPAVKRVTSASGEFDGIVVSTIEPERLLGAYRDVDFGRGEFVGVAERDGRVLAASRLGATGKPAHVELPPSAGDPSIAWLQSDGVGYLVVSRPLPGTELVVFMAKPESEVLTGNHRFAGAMASLAGLALLALSLPIGFAARRSLRLLREREALEARARIDPLTQAYVRATLEDRLRTCLAAFGGSGETFTLAFIDIDHFKALNDSQGHAVGDRALSRVAGILQASVRKTDIVARIGGDEFAVLLPAAGASATRRVFQQVIELLRVLTRDEGWPISFSIGVVTFLSPPRSSDEAIALADRAMYAVKRTTKDGVCFSTYGADGLSFDPSAEPAAAQSG